MKIDNLNIYGGNVNFAEKLKIVTYSDKFKLSKKQFFEVQELLLQTNAKDKEILNNEFVKYKSEISPGKKNIIRKNIEAFIESNVLPIGYSVAGSAVFEILKSIL
nr:hypothetical protein [uncultured Draconibacterium sp.]